MSQAVDAIVSAPKEAGASFTALGMGGGGAFTSAILLAATHPRDRPRTSAYDSNRK